MAQWLTKADLYWPDGSVRAHEGEVVDDLQRPHLSDAVNRRVLAFTNVHFSQLVWLTDENGDYPDLPDGVAADLEKAGWSHSDSRPVIPVEPTPAPEPEPEPEPTEAEDED